MLEEKILDIKEQVNILKNSNNLELIFKQREHIENEIKNTNESIDFLKNQLNIVFEENNDKSYIDIALELFPKCSIDEIQSPKFYDKCYNNIIEINENIFNNIEKYSIENIIEKYKEVNKLTNLLLKYLETKKIEIINL
jgi:hypothetical protein